VKLSELDARRAAKGLREQHGEAARAVVEDLISALPPGDAAALILRQILAALKNTAALHG
jgi:hypothetical protein